MYIADRDDIFLLDEEASAILRKFGTRWKSVAVEEGRTVYRLAQLGILECRQDDGSEVEQQAYSGVHLIGDFADVPLVENPLLLNCFSTAWCPLKCVYCHADDLMRQEVRAEEELEGIRRVVDTANLVPALVYVITGGDPLSRPQRASRLAEAIHSSSGVVLDTSGVGSTRDAIELLRVRPMHARVSIDSMDPRINLKTRPINKLIPMATIGGSGTALELAIRFIDVVAPHAVGLSVQTVISSKNDHFDQLSQMRDWLISLGVRNWVLHVAVNAGAALRFKVRTEADRKRASAETENLSQHKQISILPDRHSASRSVKRLIDETKRLGLAIDIRCTDGNTAPNSVFLVGSEGTLFTQGRGPDGGRKVVLFEHGRLPKDVRKLWTYVSCLDHVQRYINFVPNIHGATPQCLPLR